MRENDPVALPRRVRASPAGKRPHLGIRCNHGAPRKEKCRHRLPRVPALSPPERSPKHCLWNKSGKKTAAGDRRRTAGTGRSNRIRRHLPRRTLRRAAAAHRHRPGTRPAPKVLLFDEPFSNLDRTLRLALRRDLARILRHKAVPALFVTHDREEAFELGDRTAVLEGGRIHQIAPARTLYRFPASPFVARLIGSGLFLPATVGEAGKLASSAVGTIPLPDKMAAGPVQIYLPADAVRLHRKMQPGCLPATIKRALFRGYDTCYDLQLTAPPRLIFTNLPDTKSLAIGEEVFLQIDLAKAGPAFPARK